MTKEIIIHVRGGMVQDIIDIPKGTKVKVIDWDVEGIEEDYLTKNDGIFAVVSEW